MNLLEMVQGYRVLIQTVFGQDDRFFLRLQRRDMICSTSSDEESKNE